MPALCHDGRPRTPGGVRPTMGLNMRKIALSLAVLAAILLPTLHAAPVHAAPQTWVSRSGSDTNVCSTGAPCGDIPYAVSQTDPGGEVSCLDAGGLGAGVVTIT